jgi:hypothetical protein
VETAWRTLQGDEAMNMLTKGQVQGVNKGGIMEGRKKYVLSQCLTHRPSQLLFERFVRLKRDLSTPVRGCGLGLYISKQLVQAMGGHIWVESSGRAGEGSRFCFTLPDAADTSLPARASDLSRATKVVSK